MDSKSMTRKDFFVLTFSLVGSAVVASNCSSSNSGGGTGGSTGTGGKVGRGDGTGRPRGWPHPQLPRELPRDPGRWRGHGRRLGPTGDTVAHTTERALASNWRGLVLSQDRADQGRAWSRSRRWPPTAAAAAASDPV